MFLMSKHAMDTYRSVGTHAVVMEATPHQLISLLYSGAVDRLSSARGALEREDRALQGNLVGRVISIVDALAAALDHDVGGDLANNLSALYDYMQRRLLDAAVSSDSEALREVEQLLSTLRDAWNSMPIENRNPVSASYA
jgi:flagellar protein FliS